MDRPLGELLDTAEGRRSLTKLGSYIVWATVHLMITLVSMLATT